ncbi:MAG: radical SAM protein [Nanoarchaeota archaeon]|nr:radical SAM protein [Nanoarchaeota archaeon]
MNQLLNFVIEPFLNKKFRTLTFFITNRCDSKCKHCFYWKNLGKGEELSLDKTNRISKSMENFHFLSLSGGEPFLREDIPELCHVFYTQNKVRDISIPTNSMQPEKILELTKKILAKCPEAKVSLNISLDGLEDMHDKTRGVKGAFKKTIQNIKNLSELKETNSNLILNISTVISNVNIGELEKLINFVKNNVKVDNHSFEILRGSPKDTGFRPINAPQFKKLKKLMIANNYFYFKNKGSLKAWYLKKRLNYFFDQQYRVLNNQNWEIPCLAGKVMAVIEPNGEVKPCELLDSIGNLKDFDYDFKKLLKSKKSKKMKQWIKKTECSCTHCVALNSSISHNPSAVFIKALLK